MHFKLFANCIPVKGAAFSIICDLQRQSYSYIPNFMYAILESELQFSVEMIKQRYPDIFTTIEEYFTHFVDREFGFYTDEPSHFPPLSRHYESPHLLTNCILDVDAHSMHDYPSIFRQLSELGCPFLEIRFYDPISEEELKSILTKMEGLRFKNLQLLLKYSDLLQNGIFLKAMVLEFQFIGSIVLHSSPSNEQHDVINQKIRFVKEEVTSADCCGNISKDYFSVNISTFTESLTFNSCLNKKISIDTAGMIKNCPSMKESFGSINTTSLYSILKTKKFQKMWNIHKDEIKVCQDCQFRYICTDCRAFVDNLYDKPVKCNYNPYTNTWNESLTLEIH